MYLNAPYAPCKIFIENQAVIYYTKLLLWIVDNGVQFAKWTL